MQIDIYSITDDPRTLVKNVTTNPSQIDSRTGAVRGSIDILRPEVLVEGGVVLGNYAHISDFNRWYFIEEREAVRKGLQRLSLRVDVLMSYADQIKTCPAVCARSANVVNAFLPDSRRPELAFKTSCVYTFSPLTYSAKPIVVITVG